MNYDVWLTTEPANYDEKPFDPADDLPDGPPEALDPADYDSDLP